MGYVITCFFGLIAGSILGICSVVFSDYKYETLNNLVEKGNEVCIDANSTPTHITLSSTVKCKNGATFKDIMADDKGQ